MQEQSKSKALRSEDSLLPQWDDEVGEDGLRNLAATPAARESIQDLLHPIPDRGDLERLFEKNVSIAQIVELLGRNVDRQDIQSLIDSRDVQAAVRELLSSRPESDQ